VVSHFVHRFCGVCVFCFGYAHYCKLSFVFKLKVPQKRNTKVVQHIIYTKKLKMRKQKNASPRSFCFFFASRRNFFFRFFFPLGLRNDSKGSKRHPHTHTHTHTHTLTHTHNTWAKSAVRYVAPAPAPAASKGHSAAPDSPAGAVGNTDLSVCNSSGAGAHSTCRSCRR